VKTRDGPAAVTPPFSVEKKELFWLLFATDLRGLGRLPKERGSQKTCLNNKVMLSWTVGMLV